MANPDVWCRGQWDTFLLVAHLADQEDRDDSPVYQAAHAFFVLQTRSLSCEPCRKYYSHHAVAFNDSCRRARSTGRPHSKLSLVEFLHAMNRFVQAKICGTNGIPVTRGTGHVLQLKQRNSVLDPACIVSNAQILTMFLIQCRQAMRHRDAQKKKQQACTNFRAGCILYSLIAFLHVVEKSRHDLFRMCDAVLQRWTKTQKKKKEAISAEGVFQLVYSMYNCLPDVTSFTSVQAATDRIDRAFCKGPAWLKLQL